MIDLFTAETPESSAPQIDIATVGSASSSGVTLILAGQVSATSKKYKRLITGQTLSQGDRVLVARISGSYVVLGKIAYS